MGKTKAEREKELIKQEPVEKTTAFLTGSPEPADIIKEEQKV